MAPEILNRVDLILGREARSHLVHSEFARHRFRGVPTITGQHHGSQPEALQFLQDAARLRPDLVTQQNPADQSARNYPDFAQLRRCRRKLLRPGGERAVFEEFATSQHERGPLKLAPQPLSGEGFKLFHCELPDVVRSRVTHDRACDWVMRLRLQ